MAQTIDDKMSPDASPNNSSSGVRRVNSIPLFILGGAVALFLLIIALVAHDRSQNKNKDPSLKTETTPSRNTQNYAKALTNDYQKGMIPAYKKKEVRPIIKEEPKIIPVEKVIKIVRPKEQDLPPLVRPNTPEKVDLNKLKREQELEKIRQEKYKIFLQAVRAKSNIKYIPINHSMNNIALSQAQKQQNGTKNNNPTEAFKKGINKLQNNNNNLGADSNSKEPIHDRWFLGNETQSPTTPYLLRAGFVIPAVLISGINSDLPGQIMAQISQNVYDTPRGKYLLLPQGSRLVGTYSNNIRFGQERVLIAWQRIVFPDGKALDIGEMPGADNAGYSGFTDLVNNHYIKIFGSAILMSAITAGITLSQEDDTVNSQDNRSSTSQVLSESLGQQLGSVATKMIEKNLNIAPTLEIRPGYRFNVMVIKDLLFKTPYKSFDY
jgi:type IV secretion system protein TrbI